MSGFIDFQPDWILWILLPVLAGAVGLSVFTYSRTKPAIPNPARLLLIGLRSLTILLVTLLIFHPMLEKNETVNQYPDLTVWIDQSQSVNRWMSPVPIDEIIQSSINDLSDSVSVSIRYFDSVISDRRDSLSQSGKQTVFYPVVQSATEGLNVVVSDGRFDDQDWLFQKPAGHWLAWILGDTTQPSGFSFLPGMNREITGFMGDTIRVPAGIRWNDVNSDSLLLNWDAGSSKGSRWVKLEGKSGSRMLFAPVFADSAGIKRVSFSIQNPEKTERKIQRSEVRVLERYRNIWIISHQPDPLIGFFQRQFQTLGTFNVQVTIDSEAKGGTQWRSGPPVNFSGLIIAIDYPVTTGKYGSVFRKLAMENPVILLSGKPLNTAVKPDWIPGNRSLPVELSTQPWIFLPVSSSQMIWSRFSIQQLNDMPPPTEPLTSVPAFTNPQSILTIAGKSFSYPTSWMSPVVPKRLWIAKTNFDDWDRFDALSGRTPSGITGMWQSLLKEMLTPVSQKALQVSVSQIPGSGAIAFVIAPDQRITGFPADSLTGVLKVGGQQTILPAADVEGIISHQVVGSSDQLIAWTVSMQSPDGRQFLEKGVYNPVVQETDKTVDFAATEPLRSWLSGFGGRVFTGLPDKQIIREELEKRIETEVHSVVLDSWNLVGIFLLILILLTTEWIIRKRLGAL